MNKFSKVTGCKINTKISIHALALNIQKMKFIKVRPFKKDIKT